MSENSGGPELKRRRANKKSTMKQGRTMSARLEKVESSSERLAAREKVEKKKKRRAGSVFFGFLLIFGMLGVGIWKVYEYFTTEVSAPEEEEIQILAEVVDEDGTVAGQGITRAMKEYISKTEAKFKEDGFMVEKVVVPTGKIREVDFYLAGKSFYIKMNTDRGVAVSVEDAERMMEYVESTGITPEYVDVRVERKGFWK